MADISFKLGIDSKTAVGAVRDVEKSLKGLKSNVSGTQSVLDKVTGGFSRMRSVIFSLPGAIAAIGIAFGGLKIVKLAQEQENAVNDLNIALKSTGLFSKGASESLQEFAATLQASSKFGDEVILQNMALLQSLGRLDSEGLKKGTQAALDLASALRIDLRSATQLVGKAAAGEIGSFSRYGIIIKSGATNAHTFANAIDAINRQFGGAALGQLNTFEGVTAQLSNTFGDFLEVFGLFLIQNPVLIKSVREITKTFQDLQSIIRANGPAIEQLVTKVFTGMSIAVKAAGSGILALSEGLFTAIATVRDNFDLILSFIKAVFVIGIAKGLAFLAASAVSAFSTMRYAMIQFQAQSLGTLSVTQKAMVALGIETKTLAANMALLRSSLKAIGTLVIVAQMTDLIQKFTEAREVFGSFGSYVRATILSIQINIERLKIFFLETLAAITQKIQELSAPLSRLFGTKQQNLQVMFRETGIEISKSIDKIEELEAQIEGLRDVAKDVSKDLKDSLNIQASVAVGAGPTPDRGAAASSALFDRFGGKLTSTEGGGAFGKEMSAFFSDASNKFTTGILGALPDVFGAIKSGGMGVLKAGISVAATAIAGPLGAVVSEIINGFLDIFGAAPEVFREMIMGIFEEIPQIFINILQNLINLPDIIIEGVVALIEQIPMIAEKLVEAIITLLLDPTFWIRLSIAATNAVIRAIPALIKGIISGIVNGFKNILNNFKKIFSSIGKLVDKVKSVGDIFGKVADAIKGLIDKIKGIGGGIFQKGGSFVSKAVGTVKKVFGFATGGQGFVKSVPSGFPADTFQSSLTSGELVVDRSTAVKLKSFLDNQTDKKDTTITDALLAKIANLLELPLSVQTTAYVRESAFADIMLNLSRSNARIA